MRYTRLLIALAAAILGGVLVYESSQVRVRDEEVVSVVVAASDLPARTVLSAVNLKIASVPRYTVPAGALSKVGDATGRVLRDPLFTGEILNERRMATGSEFSASQLIPSDKTYAFNLPVGFFVAAPPRLVVHDRIDIVAYPRGKPLDQGTVLVSNLEVIDLPGRALEIKADNVSDAAYLTVGATAPDIVKILSARDGFVLGIGLRPYAGPAR